MAVGKPGGEPTSPQRRNGSVLAYAAYTVCAGLNIVGFTGFVGLLFYGDSNPLANVLLVVLNVVLTVVAGLSAVRIVTWLSSGVWRRP